jgi:hypothetical protein
MTWTLKKFAESIIEGPGGMNVFGDREMVVFHGSDRVHAAQWAIKCLANPLCEGSEEALAAIIERRKSLAAAETKAVAS